MEINPNRFDVCVIGGGPSGYAAAVRALDFGKTVLLVERSRLGGAGLHDGALSSKTFWEISKEYDYHRNYESRHGRVAHGISFAEVNDEVLKAVHKREMQLQSQFDTFCDINYPCNLSIARGTASLLSRNEIHIDGETTMDVFADYIILATGSRPRLLPEINIDEKHIFSSDGIGHLEKFPESLVILGAGVIGCEFATIFANFGQTRVFLIDKAERILPFEDEDLSAVIHKNLENKGAVVHKGSRLKRMEVVDGMVEYDLSFADGRTETYRVEKALISVGRVPNVDHLGLDNAGVELDSRGHVKNWDSRTTAENIFAVGDLTADIALVNVGELEGRHAVEQIWGNPPPLCHDNISTIMFLCPEVAGVGMNEQQAREKGIAYKTASVNYNCIPRAIAMRQTEGFFKIIVSAEDNRILGMRAVGEHASSAIQAVALLIAMKKTAEELAELIHPHPSIIEGIQEAARLLSSKSILKPDALPGEMKYTEWRP